MGKEKIGQIIVFILISLISVNSRSQNLVNNPSFEQYDKLPKERFNSGKDFHVTHWNLPNKATADFFLKIYPKCGEKNIVGNQIAKDKYNYVGIITYNLNDYGEFLQTKLKEKLRKDSLYCVTYYASLADKSNFYSNNLGALLSKEKLRWKKTKYKTQRSFSEYEPQRIYFHPQIVASDYIWDKEIWTEVRGLYKAQGGEKYLTIGSFSDERNYRKSPTYYEKRNDLFAEGIYVYYYIDDVSVIPVSSAEECPCAKIPQPEIPEPESPIVEQTPFKDTIVGSRAVLNNIYFALNDSTLLDSSYTELMQLLSYMEQHPSLKIEVSGHTDDTGTDAYNQTLSEARARAVVNYLEQKGIASKRLTYKGYGRTKPLINDTTETARAKNRRVEFVVR